MKLPHLTALVAGVGIALSTCAATPAHASSLPVSSDIATASVVHVVTGTDPDKVGSGSNTTAAQNALHTDVHKKVAGNSYELDGGGVVQGSNIIGSNGTISEAVYGRLSSDAQNKFVQDVVTASKQLTEPSRDDYDQTAATKPYDKSTVKNWFRELQSQGGMGSQLLTALMQDVKPDIIGAHTVLEPFKGPMNTAMGVLAVAIMMFIGISVLLDIFYISIPFFQNFMDSNGNGNGGALSKMTLITPAAKKAAEVAQEGKEPMWYYIRKRFISMLALTMALLYLAIGQIWGFIGGLVDLFSNTTGI